MARILSIQPDVRVIEDVVERAMWDTERAADVFALAIRHAHCPAKCSQLADRAAVMMAIFEELHRQAHARGEALNS